LRRLWAATYAIAAFYYLSPVAVHPHSSPKTVTPFSRYDASPGLFIFYLFFSKPYQCVPPPDPPPRDVVFFDLGASFVSPSLREGASQVAFWASSFVVSHGFPCFGTHLRQLRAMRDVTVHQKAFGSAHCFACRYLGTAFSDPLVFFLFSCFRIYVALSPSFVFFSDPGYGHPPLSSSSPPEPRNNHFLRVPPPPCNCLPEKKND